jgi:ribokinase
VVVTLGPSGAVYAVAGSAPEHVPGAPAEAVDTTGAGDTFCGVLAAAVARRLDPLAAIRLACAAASLSVERPGAAGSVPQWAEIEARSAQAYGSGCASS